VDVITYNHRLAHVYLPRADSSTIAIVGISSSGAASVLKTADTVEGAHCVTADDRDQVYVCAIPHTAESSYSRTRRAWQLIAYDASRILV